MTPLNFFLPLFVFSQTIVSYDKAKDIDFTKDQYQDLSYKNLIGEVCTRDSILNYPDTLKRFDILKTRFTSKNDSV